MIDLRHGGCLDVLRGMESDSVHCVVTSPPYWGLRDYGTAKWEGGDPACDHSESTIRTRRNLAVAAIRCDGGTRKSEDRKDHERLTLPYRDVCGKCGATRIDAQIGLEPTVDAYVTRMVEIFREVRRVLRAHGTCWLNIGDSYASGKGTCYNPGGGRNSLNAHGERKEWGAYPLNRGNKSALAADALKPKDLALIPFRLALALQADGWYVRSDIIWSKPNPMPESVTDRPTTAHEHIFLLTKSPRYYYDAAAIMEPCVSGPKRHGASISHGLYRNKRTVWHVGSSPYRGAHFATFPPKLIEPCVLAGCPPDGTVLDPFMGSGTTGLVAVQHGRNFVGIELNADYMELARERIQFAGRK